MLSPFMRRKIILGLYYFNVSRDGVLKADDLANCALEVARALRPGEEAARDRLVKVYRELWDFYMKPHDKDGDDRVSIEEVLVGHEAFLQHPQAKEMGVEFNKRFFDALDFNGDGTIDQREFGAFLSPLGLSSDRTREAFEHLDRNGDGHISREEFALNWWEYWNGDDPAAPGNWFYGG